MRLDVAARQREAEPTKEAGDEFWIRRPLPRHQEPPFKQHGRPFGLGRRQGGERKAENVFAALRGLHQGVVGGARIAVEHRVNVFGGGEEGM